MKFGLEARTLLVLLLALSFLQITNTTKTIAQTGLDTKAAPENRRDFSGLSRLPLEFIENRGQWGDAAKFVAQRGPMPASFYNDRIKLHLGPDQSSDLTLTFEGASKNAQLAGEGRRSGYHNFFFGNDPKRWHAKVASFASVLYSGLYPGVDMRVREEGSKLEYDVILAPRTDLAKVAIRADGASEIEIAGDGSLILRTAHGPVRQTPPLTWEETTAGERQPIECRFRKIDARRYGFEVSGRNPERRLVIDPGLEWSTFLGGGGHDAVYDMALARDGSGDVVLIGFTRSFDFPRTNGSLGPLGQAPFVARINASGTRLVYSTLFGGSGVDSALGLAVDSSSAPVVVGNTSSSDFPVTAGSYDTSYNGDYDAFVSRFDPTGGQLVFASYLGGSRSDPSNPTQGYEEAWAVDLDPSGNIIVAGNTTSLNFPVTAGAYDTTASPYRDANFNSMQDSFVARLNPAGTSLSYSTYLGGHGVDYAQDMKVDSQGFVIVTGRTVPVANRDASGNEIPLGTPFPTTADAFDRTLNGNPDVYLARLRLDGAGSADLKYSTLLGGNDTEDATCLAIDPNNPALITIAGWTYSGNFPVTAGVIGRTHFAPTDTVMAFVSRFRFPAAGGGSLLWSTYYGAPGNQQADDVVIDNSGAAIIVGASSASNPPTTERSYDRTPAISDGFIARISSDATQLLYSTLLGGSSFEATMKVVYAGGSRVIVAGRTKSPDFPITPGAYDPVYATDGSPSDFTIYDIFLSRMSLEPIVTGDTTATPPSLLSPAEGASFTAPASPTFDWNDVGDASGVEAYHIQVSPNPNFTDDIIAELTGWYETWAPISQATTDFSSSNRGTFYWRVRTLDSVHNLSAWSAVRTFTIGTPATPSAPALLSPANNSQLPSNQEITFSWNAASSAATYEIQIDDSDRFSAPLTTSRAGITQTQFAQSFSSQKRYWWRVRGRNSLGTNGAWSAVRVFEIRGGATPPPPPANVTLSTLSLNPTSVTGGNSSQGTVTLTGVAPSGGAVVTLSDNSASASVPPNVTVAAGSSSASFTVTTSSVTASTVVTISASFGSVTRTATLTVAPAATATDTVAIQQAEYSSSGRVLRVEATCSNSTSTLSVYVTSTGALIGTLRNEGGGRYRGDLSWSSNPQNITVRSNRGGSATRAVTAK